MCREIPAEANPRWVSIYEEIAPPLIICWMMTTWMLGKENAKAFAVPEVVLCYNSMLWTLKAEYCSQAYKMRASPNNPKQATENWRNLQKLIDHKT